MMNQIYKLFMLVLVASSPSVFAQIPTKSIINVSDLYSFLKQDVQENISASGAVSEAGLAQYFREEFSERYFYDWKNFEHRFDDYNLLYNTKSDHQVRASDHMQKFSDSTQWVLPFNYLNGEPVNAYALRHLARSHKMVDIAFQYYYDNKDPRYIRYFVNQMGSLNAALESDAYEKIEDGNGVYEAFRSGYRILNWLRVHNMFLSQEAYTDYDQLRLIATMLQHGQHLYDENESFHSGNHQTRGMSALAMLAILLSDFEGTDLWYERAMSILAEHLNKEINEDGFQFERSVHYHISDIGNYFYVYQLAQINKYNVSPEWKDQLQSLFTTLTKIAYPDKTAPVLQDDTDSPWAEKNDISNALTLGYLLFDDPSYGYFANEKVERTIYWFLKDQQLSMLKDIEKEKPVHSSLSFEETGYYIMREGWSPNDKMLIISAGLDDKKPDHQHGDMLGVQAMANGNVLLPNYQVRYSLEDYEFFKNSMVKNVALVDNELQGKDYRGNKGGSGFGKFGVLPNPEVVAWLIDSNKEVFIGEHDGFKNVGVSYSRQVINIENRFWIVKDNFKSAQNHQYKQVWQGHYTASNNNNLIRATYPNGTGFDILQLKEISKNTTQGTQGKEWTVISTDSLRDFSFITILYPYKAFDQRLDDKSEMTPTIGGWMSTDLSYDVAGVNHRALHKNDEVYLFETDEIRIAQMDLTLSEPMDFYINDSPEKVRLECIGNGNTQVVISGKKKVFLNGERQKKPFMVKTGDILEIIK